MCAYNVSAFVMAANCLRKPAVRDTHDVGNRTGTTERTPHISTSSELIIWPP